MARPKKMLWGLAIRYMFTENKGICPQLVFVNGSLNAPRVQ